MATQTEDAMRMHIDEIRAENAQLRNYAATVEQLMRQDTYIRELRAEMERLKAECADRHDLLEEIAEVISRWNSKED